MIDNLLNDCVAFKFYKERVRGNSSIYAEYVLYNNSTYYLNLFTNKESGKNEKQIYIPISYIVKSANEKDAKKYIDDQERKVIEHFEVQYPK